jgi:hypothetical protein
MEQHNSFCYTYSAQQQKEVEAIRRKYLPREEDKMAQLRRLHSIPTRKAVCASIGIGVPGLLLLGTGMSLCMTELGDVLGIYAMAVGIGVGLAGIALAALAYPVYNLVLKRQREKIAPQILQLTDELLK